MAVLLCWVSLLPNLWFSPKKVVKTYLETMLPPCGIFWLLIGPYTTKYFFDARMRLCHPPDGSTSPKYKLLCFITTKNVCKENNALAFNWDRCCHLVLCLRLIPFHCINRGFIMPLWDQMRLIDTNGKVQFLMRGSTVNRALDGSTNPS